MGLMQFKIKTGLIFILFILASLVSSSSAGRATKSVTELAKQVGATNNEESLYEEEEDDDSIHERLLRANSRDYGRYNPAPALVRPPFKLIPN